MFDIFSEKLGAIAVKLNSNKYLTSIKDSFTGIIPFVIVGSIGTLLGSVVFSTTGLASIHGLEQLTLLIPWFNQLNYATMNIIALLIAFNIGKNLAKQYGREGSYEGLLSLICFVLVSPTTLSTLVEGKQQVILNVLSSDVTAAKGLFVAMIIGLLSITIFCKLTEIEKLKIKLPDQVPPNVGKSFSDLLPTIIVALVISGLSFLFEVIVGSNFANFVFATLQTPIQVIFQYPLGIIFASMFAAMFWICGLHGASIVNGIIAPITIAALQTNMSLVAAGQEATEIVVKPFWNLYATMGGFGCTLALIIAILLVSRRQDDKAIATLSLAPGLFGINEPILFGLPIVLNPIMAIPFVLCPVICCSIGYASIYFGLSAKIISDVPWCLPPVINGFIATGGDLMTCLVQLICMVISILIWIPFVKIRNKEVNESI